MEAKDQAKARDQGEAHRGRVLSPGHADGAHEGRGGASQAEGHDLDLSSRIHRPPQDRSLAVQPARDPQPQGDGGCEPCLEAGEDYELACLSCEWRVDRAFGRACDVASFPSEKDVVSLLRVSGLAWCGPALFCCSVQFLAALCCSALLIPGLFSSPLVSFLLPCSPLFSSPLHCSPLLSTALLSSPLPWNGI